MAKFTEQLTPTKSSFRKTRRFIKKSTAKYARRLGKRLLEDAPSVELPVDGPTKKREDPVKGSSRFRVYNIFEKYDL